MHDVFISYSTKDMLQAESVRDVLEKNGIPCWMAPRDIPGGSNYAGEIPRAIRGCQVFLLILSENAQTSNWVVKELDNAVNCGKIIIPLMLEDCPLNDEFNFLLTGAQRYAAYQKRAEVLNTLVERIRAVTGTKPGAKAEAQAAAVPVEVPAAVKAPAAPEVPKKEKKPSAPKAAAAPVVQKAKPQKPKKEREKIPFVFGRTEKLAALGIPGMALVSVLGYLLGNSLFFSTTYNAQYSFGSVVLYPQDYIVLSLYLATGILLGALLWWEWVRFRHRELAENPEAPLCPACGSDRLSTSTFRTRRMTWQEKTAVLLIPLCMVANLFVNPVVLVLLDAILSLRIAWQLQWISVGMMFAALLQGLAVGLWLSNMLVRRLRRRKGLGSSVCRCTDCRAAFLPVTKSKG